MHEHIRLIQQEEPVCIPGPDGHCSICGDEAQPGHIVELRANNMALLEMPYGREEVAVDLIDRPQVGDQLLVHLGFAIARLEDAG